MSDVMSYACGDVVDYLYDDLSVLLPRIVKKYEARAHRIGFEPWQQKLSFRN